MRLLPARALLPFALALSQLACSKLVDLDVTYRDCFPITTPRYAEEFDPENSVSNLRDHCWKTDNEGVVSGKTPKIFLDDGDGVVRASAPSDRWADEDQGPMLYRKLEGDFLFVARVEAINQGTGDLCLDPGNTAGIVIRRSDAPAEWATFMVHPFIWTQGTVTADCHEDTDDTNDPTASVAVTSYQKSWGEDRTVDNVGADGEADIAVCRVGAAIYFYYGAKTADPLFETWKSPGPPHDSGGGPLDVGVTVSGAGDFAAEGHINWAVYELGIGDGCSGKLENFVVPEGD